jgi:hypothetical protein
MFGEFDVLLAVVGLYKYIGYVAVIGGAVFAVSKRVRLFIISKVRGWAKVDEQALRDDRLEQLYTDLKAEIMNDLKEVLERQALIIKQQECITTCNQDLLRSNINHMYFKYEASQKIPIFEKENLIKMYGSYKTIGGNSYIDHLYEIMMSWDSFQKTPSASEVRNFNPVSV